MSEEELKKEVVEEGPLIVGVHAAHSGFYNVGSKGQVLCQKNPRVDHTVLLIGYTSTNWIIKNSLGQTWGDNGYGYIPINGNDCGIREWVTGVYENITNSNNGSQLPKTKLKVLMKDSYGDGWNDNILGIKSNNKIIAVFGQ